MGFVILAHEGPARVAGLARHLNGQGAPVVIHYDRRSRDKKELIDGLPGEITVTSRYASEWGRFGLVEATLDAVRRLIEKHGDLTHVFLLSGSCLPLRPVEELEGFLSAHPETDFIEAEDPDRWITGGLGIERFSLHHPVGWKSNRGLFDRLVDAQRWLGMTRKMPPGLVPRLGRQWWCLRTSTLGRVLAHPDLRRWKRFFRSVWIPDEAFFQTLTASMLPEETRDPRGLTLTLFDPDGNPWVAHDDHRGVLEETDHFFVRKLDPDATGLREWAYARRLGHSKFSGGLPEALTRDHPAEHAGLQMAGRFPRRTGVIRPGIARPYLVIFGTDPSLLALARHRLIEARPEAILHGRLFADDAAEFATPGTLYHGNLSGEARLRDYRPMQFLARLLWIARKRPVAFLLHPADNAMVLDAVAHDPQASFALVGDAALPEPASLALRVQEEELYRDPSEGDLEDLAGLLDRTAL